MKHFCALDTPLLKKEEGAGGEVVTPHPRPFSS